MADDIQNDVKDEVAELVPFDRTKKKKKEKKKKKPAVQDGVGDSVEKLAENMETLSVSLGLESTFTGLKKKKKKPAGASLLNRSLWKQEERICMILQKKGKVLFCSSITLDTSHFCNCLVRWCI